MNEKTLTTLEFDKVLARLAANCAFSAGRELALSLRPATDYAEVVHRQRLTAEARRLLSLKPNFTLGGAHDVRALAHKASLGGILEPSELLDIQSTLGAGRNVRNHVIPLSRSVPLLAAIAQTMPDLGQLANEIARCINQRGEVVDNASPQLALLRQQIRVTHDRLLARVNDIMAASAARGIAQEPIVTLRDGRYVVPVKAEMRSQLPGIVHDVSHSGATVFVEPLATVELGNAWREAQIEEQHEVERILRRLSDMVGIAESAVVANVDGLAQFDLALAKVRLGDSLKAHAMPDDSEEQAWIVRGPAELRLVEARHPLLRGNVVPISLRVGGDFTVLLITGPNTGGKTVALKTAGLLTLMAQAGLPVPAAEGSQIPVFANVFADIGDEQSIEQSLSTFSSHMGNIIAILGQVTRNSLVLLDELAAGTDPVEGAALAQAIIKRLLEVGAPTIATTHHGALKAFAHVTPGVMNASVEFDPETLAPTYRLSIGLPGQSNALAIAARLGLPEDILNEARRAVAPEEIELSQLLTDLRRQQERAASAQRRAERARREAESLESRRQERLAKLEAQQEEMLAATRRQLERELAEARKRLRAAMARLEKAEAKASAAELERAARNVAQVDEQFESLQRRRYSHQRRAATAPRGPRPSEVQPGDLLWLMGLDRPGEALSPPDAEGEIEVALGPLRTRVKVSQVERVERPGPGAVAPAGVRIATATVRPPVPPLELHLRGMTVDDALIELDQYLDSAFRAGLPSVRIVHGKGTGTLRRAIQEHLARHPLVKSYAPATPAEGGEGATVAQLAV